MDLVTSQLVFAQGYQRLTLLQGGGMWEGEEERMDVEDQLRAVAGI